MRPTYYVPVAAGMLVACLTSFPSGHASAAFSAATVLADGRPKLKWFWHAVAAGARYSFVRESAVNW